MNSGNNNTYLLIEVTKLSNGTVLLWKYKLEESVTSLVSMNMK